MLNIFKFRNGLNIIPDATGATDPNSMGDLAVSSVDGKLYYNNGVDTEAVLTETSSGPVTNKQLDDTTVFFVHTADNTIQIHFNALGTTGTKTTITSSQTANRVITLPDATDTLVGKATTDILTNKSIDGLTNTITNVSLTTGVTGVLPIANGGTSASTKTAAFDALQPMTTGGDLIYGGASGTGLRLANGTLGQVLTSGGGTAAPTWQTPSPGFVNPMTTVGDMIIGGASGTATRLAATTNGFILTLVGGSPAWQANSGGGGTVTSVTASSPLASSGGTTPNISLTGIVPVANGGTGSSSQNFVDLTTTQSISGSKTFNSKISTPGLIMPQIATPASPASGSNDLYFKADGFLYMLDSNGIESLVSPGITGTNWDNSLAWTTTGSGFGTSSPIDIRTRRVGDTMEVEGYFLIGTNSAAVGYLNIPTGLAIDSTKLSSTVNASLLGTGNLTNNAGQGAFTSGKGLVLFYDGSTTNKVFFGYTSGAAVGQFTKDNVQAYSNSGDGVNFSFKVPIAGWTVNNGASPGQLGSTFFASSLVTTDSSVITGTVFTTFSNSPAFTFTPTISGTYKVYSNPVIWEQGASDQAGYARIFNTSGSAVLLYESQGIVYGTPSTVTEASSIYIQSVYTLTAGVSYVFDIQGRNNVTGSITLGLGGTSSFHMFAELSADNNSVRGSGGVLFQSSAVSTRSGAISSGTFTTFDNSPAFSFTPSIAGNYKVYSPIPIYLTGAGANGQVRVFNTSGAGATLVSESQGMVYGNTGDHAASAYSQSIYTLNAGTTYTFDIQGRTGSGNVEVMGDNATFYMFAELSTLLSPAQSNGNNGSFFASSQITTISSAITSSSFTTFSNSPAFTFSPTISGTYRVYSSAMFEDASSGNFGSLRIFNTSGSAVLLNESQAGIFSPASGAAISSVHAQSVYTLTSGNTYTFDIQGLAQVSGSVFLRGDVSAFYMFAELSTIGAGGGGGGGVSDLNTLTGSVTLAAGIGITITPSGNTLTIAASGSLSNPMTTGGDTIYGGASGVPTRLANGTNGQVLTSSGGTSAPTWTTPSGGGSSFDFFTSSAVTSNSSNITGTSFVTFSTSPAFTFTPNFNGTYKVYVSVALSQTTGGITAVVRVINTSGGATLLSESQAEFGQAPAGYSVYTQSTYTLTSGNSYVFDIQGKNLSTGTLAINAAANFYMFAERVG